MTKLGASLLEELLPMEPGHRVSVSTAEPGIRPSSSPIEQRPSTRCSVRSSTAVPITTVRTAAAAWCPATRSSGWPTRR